MANPDLTGSQDPWCSGVGTLRARQLQRDLALAPPRELHADGF